MNLVGRFLFGLGHRYEFLVRSFIRGRWANTYVPYKGSKE
jgi:hypothetical protein